MILSLESIREYAIEIDSFSYRGFEVKFYEDISGHQIFAIWKNAIFEFGVFNTMYKDDMKMVIDDHLDTVTRFQEYPGFWGSKLEYFQNAGSRDLRLVYKGRILKIYLDPNELKLEDIKQDARDLLYNIKEREREADT